VTVFVVRVRGQKRFLVSPHFQPAGSGHFTASLAKARFFDDQAEAQKELEALAGRMALPKKVAAQHYEVIGLAPQGQEPESPPEA
jgi:hypothetical protein